MDSVTYTRNEPHELVIHVYLRDEDEPMARESSYQVITRAWVWVTGAGARRVPDNRAIRRGVLPACYKPHDDHDVAEILRQVAARIDRRP